MKFHRATGKKSIGPETAETPVSKVGPAFTGEFGKCYRVLPLHAIKALIAHIFGLAD